MYVQAEKQLENKSKTVASFMKKTNVSKAFQFSDNRANAIAQRKLQVMTNSYSAQEQQTKPIQMNTPIIQKVKSQKPKKVAKKAPKVDLKKQSMTVRNKKNSYTSGWISGLSRATGVEPGPIAEAQKVKRFLGGSWVGGHMVNDQLGGSGGFNNIVPITSSMNGLHRSIENKANSLLSAQNGTEIQYKMKINKRATVKYGVKTVKELPIEFQQTLNVKPVSAAPYTINGAMLQEISPGNGKIQP
jgi:hypothetical protein